MAFITDTTQPHIIERDRERERERERKRERKRKAAPI